MFWDNFLISIRRKCRPVESTIIGIDVGTTKIAAVVARVGSDCPKILGVASIPFYGVTWTKSNMTAITAEAICSAVREACKTAGCSTRSAVIGISDLTTGKNTISIAWETLMVV